jgi:ATP-binding cassette subfamily F protein uup
MLAQRGADLEEKSIKQSAAAASAGKLAAKPSASSSAKRKLTFNDKHALDTLPAAMAKLRVEIAKQQKLLDDPALYTKDRKAFDAASVALTTAQTALDAAEEKWLELEMLREDIESGA